MPLAPRGMDHTHTEVLRDTLTKAVPATRAAESQEVKRKKG
jgi:hypothetical protein